jgi:hypothetical protein
MEHSAALVDSIMLIAGIVLILLTSLRVSRRKSRRKAAKGQTGAVVGIMVWLGCLGVALYLIFG